MLTFLLVFSYKPIFFSLSLSVHCFTIVAVLAGRDLPETDLFFTVNVTLPIFRVLCEKL